MSRKRKSRKNNVKKRFKKSKLLNKSKYFFIFISIILFLIIIYFLLFRSSYFELKDVEILGEYPLNSQKIFKATSIEKNKSIWLFDLKKISEDVRNCYPEYRRIIVKRKLPHLLSFEFILRKPIAQIKSGRYFLVDQYGFILPRVKNVATVDLPIIEGIDAKLTGIKPAKQNESKALMNSLELLKTIKNSEDLDFKRLVSVDASDYKNLFFELNNGIIVKIGDCNFAQRIKKLNYVLKEIKGEDIAYIDLRFKDPVLSPR